MIAFFPGPALAGTALLALVLLRLRRRGWRSRQLVLTAGFGVYLLALAAVTLFPIPCSSGWQQPAFVLSRVNLVPFRYTVHSAAELRLVWQEILRNLVMTVPFGIGLRCLTAIPDRRLAWWGLGLGLGIESAQLAISLAGAGAYRTVDISDVILNTTGVLVGGLIFNAAIRLRQKMWPLQG